MKHDSHADCRLTTLSVALLWVACAGGCEPASDEPVGSIAHGEGDPEEPGPEATFDTATPTPSAQDPWTTGVMVELSGVVTLAGERSWFEPCGVGAEPPHWEHSSQGQASEALGAFFVEHPELTCIYPGGEACYLFQGGKAIIGEAGSKSLLEPDRPGDFERQVRFVTLTTVELLSDANCPAAD